MAEIHCAYDKLVPTGELIPNKKNPNRHSDEQIRLLAKIIVNQGWRSPITVSNRSGFIVRGHGRLQAAQLAGLEAVPVDYQDYENEAAEVLDMLLEQILTPHYGIQKNSKNRAYEGMMSNCFHCGKEFYKRPSELDKMYCSRKCSYEHQSLYAWEEFTCKTCGKQFKSKKKPHSNNRNTYCSIICRNLGYRAYKGLLNPNWQGGKGTEHQRIRQTKDYMEWRKSVYTRDDYTCQECGKRGGKLHAHHKEHFAQVPEKRLDINNGTSLCKECHGKIHGMTFNGY